MFIKKINIIVSIHKRKRYFIRVFKCTFRGLNYNKIELFKKYFIHVKIPGNHGTNWEITQQEKKMLYDLGYTYATEYIEKYFTSFDI